MSRKDLDGKIFGDELERIGWVGDEKVGARKMHAMFELHIEQGPILEAEGKDIGVVTHGQGLWWLRDHADGQGRAYRIDADEHAGECGPWHGADHRARAPDRDEPPAERRGRGGAGRRSIPTRAT